MPSTPTYGLPYPGPSDQPDGPQQLQDLADAVEGELQRVDGDVAAATGDLASLAAQFAGTGVQVIGTIHSGAGTNATQFTNIPQTFEHLVIVWYGDHDGGDTIVSLGLRFNGDSGANYVSQRVDTRGDTVSIDSSGTFTVLRVGIVGRFTGSGGVVYIPHYSTSGVTKAAFGDSYGRDLVGGEYRGWGHGRWTSTAAITSIRLWPSGQLWESTPHMVLLGIPGRAS